MVHGKSRVLQVLLGMAASPELKEDALVDQLMEVVADETPLPPSKGSCGERVRRWRVSCNWGSNPTAVTQRHTIAVWW